MANKKMPTTGRLSNKPYECECGYEKEVQTNHWGEVYLRCPVCRRLTAWKCNEPVPAGYGIPEKWKIVKLKDIADITGAVCQKESAKNEG